MINVRHFLHCNQFFNIEIFENHEFENYRLFSSRKLSNLAFIHNAKKLAKCYRFIKMRQNTANVKNAEKMRP